MGDRLPDPVILIAFEPSAPLPECLRAALNTARRLRLGCAFEHGFGPNLRQFIIQPWMTLEDTMALWDPVYAASLAQHEGMLHG
jgi:hypothetical protein